MEHIIKAFLNAVAEHGNDPAVSDESSTFTYRELHDFALCVAANLQKQGIRSGSRVIVEIPRSKEYAGCLFGCWLMGAVAIPLSDDYPQERLDYIKKDSQYELSIDEPFLKAMDPSLKAKPFVAEPEAEGIVIYTSGSTGNPKGVVHDFLSMSAVAARNTIHDKSDRTDRNNIVGLIAPFTFVVGTGLLLAAVSLAKHLVIVPDEIRKDPFRLAAYYDENNIESSFVPPRMVDFMLKHNHSLKVISVGSERITNIYYNDHPVVMNGYGATEIFGGTLAFQIDKPYDNTPIGKPFGMEKAYVLDENCREVQVGELCIAGHVAKGYLNRPEETRKAFIRNPFAETDGFPRMFRTGDLVERLPDGNLLFIERKDWMIKINGQRVEPLEVESTIRRLEGVREVAVKDFTARNGVTFLVAYYAGSEDLTEEKLRAHCKANLTSYMVPAFCIRMDALPLNPNGKLDRKNLPEPDISAFKQEYAAPENNIEAALCRAAEAVLKCGRIGRNDDFFLLGGDSIKAMEAINGLEDLPLDIETFFEERTPAKIAERIAKGGADEIPFDRTARDAYPLTASQLGVYFAVEADPDTLMYNIPVSIPLGKDTDADRLAAAVEKAVANHQSFRCRIGIAGGMPCMIPQESVFAVERVRTDDLQKALKAFVRPFDLSSGNLIRACILEQGAERMLALDAHHIVFDGTSLSVLLKEIARSYEGLDLYEERTSAFDLSSREEALRSSGRYAEAEAYYRKRFEGLEISNTFPCDYEDKNLAVQDSVELHLSLTREELQKFLKSNSLTENSLFLAAFAFVLAKFNGSDRALVCVGESGRHTSATFNTVGMLVKTVALPVDLAGESDICRYIGNLQESFRESVKHDAYPFSELASEYGVVNDFSFVYQNDAFSALSLGGAELPVTGIGVPDAMNRLTLMVFRREDGYHLSFRYRSDLYQRGVMESFAETFALAVREFTEKEYLKDVRLVPECQTALLDSFNDNEMPLESKTVPEYFSEWVKKTPDHDLVVFRDRRYTYGEGGAIADRIAAHIQSLGLGRNDIVSVLVPRSEWILLATCGVLRAGCAYEPLDESYPDERLSFMVLNAGAKLLITTRELKDRITGYDGKILLTEEIGDLPPAVPAPVKNAPDDLFVLLYTSGTTGMPKGVMLTYEGTSALVQMNRKKYGIDESAVNACYASFGFDACMQDLITFPACGASLHVLPEDIRLDLAEVDRYCIENRVTHCLMTTQVGRQFALMTESPYLRYLAVGGEALVPLNTEGFTFDLCNLYGPTEATVYVTEDRVLPNTSKVTIGRTVPNVRGYVADRHLNRLPVGMPGELLIAGRQVGKGYLGLPEKTAASFIENPFTDEEHYRTVYRTGDTVRFLPDGRIDFIGRNDGQVKVRGFRVELTEVEEVIRRFEGIRDATVAAFDDPTGGKFIAAYVVSDGKVNISALNEFILAEKPPYMVPAVTMQIDAIPLNRNQKVDRRALPKPEREEAEIVKPENELQEKVLEAVSSVIGRGAVSVDADLFDSGLTSIGIIRLNVALEKAFGLPFRVSDIRENPTVRKIAELIASSGKAAEHEILPDYPVTRTQMGVYIECSAHPDTVLYNIPALLKLGEGVDPEKLAEAARTALSAHPYVHTTLTADAEGNIRARRNDAEAPRVSLIRCEKLPADEELVRPFTLLDSPLYRMAVYVTEDGNYLFMDFHHIISDGTSETVLLADMDRAYAGLPVQKEKYTGFEAALDEEALRGTEKYGEAKAWYDSVFQGCEPSCLPPKAAEKGVSGPATVIRVADVTPEKIRAYCEKAGVTPNAFFNAAFGYTLSRFGNFDDAVYTTVYNGRSDSRLSGAVCMLVRTLPVCVRASGSRMIAEMIRETQNQLMNSMANDLFSFAEISAAYGIRADIIFAWQGDEFVIGSVAGEPAEFRNPGPVVAKAPITLNVYLKDGRYQLVLDYLQEYYGREFIDCFLDAFSLTLRAFAEKKKTDSVSLLSDRAEALLERINRTDRPFENVSANRLFEHWAKEAPGRTAVICEDRKLTYGELNAAANRMAHRLIEAGVGKDSVVGMMLPRSENISVTELAILKAGGAFLGLLPDYPDDRIDYCLRDAGSRIVITTPKLIAERPSLFSADKPYRALSDIALLAEGNEENPDLDIPVDSLAYCIYTSGSTGNPKGVMIEHRNLANVAQPGDSVYRYYHGSDGGQTALALSSVSFDASVLDHMLMLLNGKTVCIATEREVHNPALLADAITRNGVDIMMTTPSLLTNLLSMAEFRPAMAGVKYIVVGAEAFPASLFGTLRELSPDILVINAYGPTECTITCCAKKLEDADGITIGGPIQNTKIYVTDAAGHILPPYACGELIITGGLVGRGYLNLPEKTKESFFTLRGLPAYHSGDLVRLNAAGEVEFFGRRDNQVKLRGFRVELDEIEKCINAFEGITRSKVIVRNNNSEDYLVGFYTADRPVDPDALNAHLKARLTYYMVPDVMMQLDAMPVTASGKIDKKALPEVRRERKKAGRKAPRKSVEQELCEIFASALSLDEFYADDNFFEMGGTSLSASKVTMQLMAKGLKVEYQDIFDHPTPEQFADYIAGLGHTLSTGRPEPSPAEDGEIQSDYPEQLQYNTLEYAGQVKREPLGNVLLSGAVGFLGIHVLRELIDLNEGKIVCLIRRGSFASPLDRLKSMLFYYFGQLFGDALETRIQIVEADITEDRLTDVLKDIPIDTVINCAACVKHYAADDILERINVRGAENMIAVAKEKNARMIQVSTISIPGVHTAETWKRHVKAYENKLFVIDDMGNKYSISKYHAELKLLEAVKNGLRGKIIRVGNLMGRHSDGEFQINFSTNAFLNAVRGFATIGKSPISHATDPMSLSPIDMTAKALVLLAGTNDMFTAFNCDSRFIIDEWQLIAAANRCGVKITPVPDEEYYADYRRMLGDTSVNSNLRGLMTNDRPDLHGVETDNKFTANVLYRLGFAWPLPTDSYLERVIRCLLEMDYFETDEY